MLGADICPFLVGINERIRYNQRNKIRREDSKKRGVNFTKNRQKEEGQNGEGKRERKRAGKK